jgi:hypothetical protein
VAVRMDLMIMFIPGLTVAAIASLNDLTGTPQWRCDAQHKTGDFGILAQRPDRAPSISHVGMPAREKEPGELARVSLGKLGSRRKIMRKHVLFAAAALVVSTSVAAAQNQITQDKQNQITQDKTSAPTAVQSTTPDKPPIATVPEAATDTSGAPIPQTSGQAPNVSKKMGAEMDSAGDQRASPDEQ